ncbi:MAG: ABC transporter permease [Ornithinimicrobium sp.]
MLRAELRLFTREPGSIFWIVAFPSALVVILGLVPAVREPIDRLDQSFLGLYVNVVVLLAMLMASLTAMPVVLAAYREQQILRRIATTPAKPRDLLIAQYGIHGVAAIVGGGLAVLLGRLAYGLALPRNMIGFLFVLLLMLATCLSIGGLIAGLARTAKFATTIGTVLLFPLMFTAGVWLPVALMSGLLGDIVALTPLGAGALALDAATSGGWPDPKDLVVMAAWTALLGTAATRFFRWE